MQGKKEKTDRQKVMPKSPVCISTGGLKKPSRQAKTQKQLTVALCYRLMLYMFLYIIYFPVSVSYSKLFHFFSELIKEKACTAVTPSLSKMYIKKSDFFNTPHCVSPSVIWGGRLVQPSLTKLNRNKGRIEAAQIKKKFKVIKQISIQYFFVFSVFQPSLK